MEGKPLYSVIHIVRLTVVAELDKSANVFAVTGLNLKALFLRMLQPSRGLRAFFIFKNSLLVLPMAGAGITNTPLSVGSSPKKLTGLSEEGWKLGSIPSLAIKLSGSNRN